MRAHPSRPCRRPNALSPLAGRVAIATALVLVLVASLVSLVIGTVLTASTAIAAPSMDQPGGTLVGTVVDVVRDRRPPAASGPAGPAAPAGVPEPESQRVLQTGSGELIPLAPGSLAGNRAGDRVRVRLGTAPDADTPASLTAGRRPARVLTATTLTQTETAAAPGERSVYVALVAPAGTRPDPAMTPATVTATLAAASSYWSSQTGGRVTFRAASVSDWRTSTRSCGDVYGLWSEARTRLPASAAPMSHLLLVAPPASTDLGCPYGFGTVGSYASGGSAYVTELAQSLFAHELGHNLGLNHANALVCAHTVDVAYRAADGWAAGCEPRDYDDLYDVMGFSGPGFGEGNLNGAHLDSLGLTPAAVTDVPASTTLSIAPLSAASAAGRVVRVHDPAGATYYVEYRTDSGRDGDVSRSAWQPELGVRVLRADPRYAGGSGSYELDATPGTGGEYARALPLGTTFVSASARVRVTVTAQSADHADLRIDVVPGSAAQSVTPGPSVTLSLPPRTTVGRSARATVLLARGSSSASLGDWTLSLERLVGRTAWREVASATSSATGAATGTGSFAFRAGLTATYRVTAVDPTATTTIRSRAVVVPSVAAVATRLVRGVPSRSATAYAQVAGTVDAGAGPRVLVQYRTSATGAWRSAGTATALSSVRGVNGQVRSTVTARVRARGTRALWIRFVVVAATGYAGRAGSAVYAVGR